MKLTAKLALIQLRENRRRSVLTLLGIVLSVAMITAVFGFVASGRGAIYDLIIGQGNYHVAYEDITPEDAEILGSNKAFESHYTETDEEGVLTLFCRLAKPTAEATEQAAEIAKAAKVLDSGGIYMNRELMMMEGYLPDTYTGMLVPIAAVLFIIIIFASVIVVSNAFRVSAGERTKQFGILKSVGATSKQIRSTVINEGWLLAIAGIPVGILVGLGVEAIGCVIANYCLAPLNTFGGIAIKMSFQAPWWVIVFAALLAFVTIFLSAYLPARKAAKIPAIDAIRGSGEVKLKAKKVRTAGAVRKIFGVEGELAQKSMKRSRRSYRATVIALSSSVILFLVGTSLGQSVKVSVNMIYPNIEATAMAQISASTSTDMEGNIVKLVKLTDAATARTLTEKFRQFDPTSSIKMLGENSGNSVFTVEAKNIFTPMSYENLTKDDDLAVDDYIITFKYIILDDAFYESVCKQAGVQTGENILLNQVLDRVDGKRALFSPCRSDINAIEVTGKNDDNSVFTETVPIGGQLTELPPELLLLTSPYSVCVVTPNKSMTSVQWLVNVEDSAGFAEYAQATLKNTLKVEQTGLYSYNASDIKAMLAAQNGLANLIMIFVYGFIAMLTLIGLTNVISTISTNIRLRKREFAVLESMGMTEKGIKRMISYESLICGLRSLFFGLVLGLAASYFIYNRITDVLLFPYSFPYVPVIAAVIVVFLVTFITMRFSAMRVSKGNIIEGIRQSE